MPPKLKKLRINPPRRRESERMKARSGSAISTPTSATSVSSAGDTIEVAQKSSDDRAVGKALGAAMLDAPAESAGDAELSASEEPSAANAQNAVAWQEKPASPKNDDDSMSLGEDDAVTEYDFSNDKDSGFDDDEDENPRGIFTDVDHDIIEISSDDGAPQDNFAIDTHPWRRMSDAARAARERMYCVQVSRALDGDWERSENYQEMLDLEMEEYIKDFKLQDWVIGVQEAQRGFDHMIERKKLRVYGVPVFKKDILNQLGFGPQHPQPPPQLMPPPPPAQHRNQGPRGYQQPMPPPHRPMHPQQMPPPHPQNMMPNGGMPYGPPHAPPMPPGVVYQPMQQVGIDQNGQPVYQPVYPGPPAPPPPAANPPIMPPPKRTASHPFAPQQRASLNGAIPAPPPQPDQSKRRKRESAPITAAASATSMLVPPYPELQTSRRNSMSAGDLSSKPGSTGRHKASDAGDIFPWSRQMNFEAASMSVQWDESIYSQATLTTMSDLREANAKVVDRIEEADLEKQRQRASRAPGAERAKPQRKESEASEFDEDGSPVASDHSSGFWYASEADQQRATALIKSAGVKNVEFSFNPTINEIMQAALHGHIQLNMLDGVMICWNPAKKGLTQDLAQAVFSIRDTVITRQQFFQMPILNRRAAKRIIDFCPDILWGSTLLRITSETPYGPSKVRLRMCLNGNYVDKSTITKRIGAALGKKQGAAALADPNNAAYLQNYEDYRNYQRYFGNESNSRKTDLNPSESSARNGFADAQAGAAQSRPGTSGTDASSVMEMNPGRGTRMTTRSSMNKGKGKAKATEVIEIDGAADALEEAVESRPASSGSEGGVVVGQRSGRTRATSNRRAKRISFMQLDGADDEDEDEEDESVVMSGSRKSVDNEEVSLQSDGELDRLLDDDSD